jgi:hypothetical protein
MLIFYNFYLSESLRSNQVPRHKEHATFRATGAHTSLDAAARAHITLNALLSANGT